MEKMFPGRQRKALKFKLRREYKDNPERIDAALSGKGCDASSYQEVVKALQKVRGQSTSWTESRMRCGAGHGAEHILGLPWSFVGWHQLHSCSLETRSSPC